MAKAGPEMLVITKVYDLVIWSCRHVAKSRAAIGSRSATGRRCGSTRCWRCSSAPSTHATARLSSVRSTWSWSIRPRQFFGNVYLNPLDHFVAEALKVPAYVRYVDDFLLLSTLIRNYDDVS